MKKDQVKTGHVYAMKVSGLVVPVRLDSDRGYRVKTSLGRFGRSSREAHLGWTGTNLKTGRQVTVRSAQKLRFELLAQDGKWVRVARSDDKTVEGSGPGRHIDLAQTMDSVTPEQAESLR